LLGITQGPDAGGTLAVAGIYAQVRLDALARGIGDLIGWPLAALAAGAAALSLWRLRGSPRIVIVAAEATHASGVAPLVALRLDRDPATASERAAA
jgi:hypothetical protein